MNLLRNISDYLGLDNEDVERLAILAPRTYKKFEIPKRKTGMRKIAQPSKETKLLQYALIEILLGKLPIHDIAMAYRRDKKTSIRDNAQIHSKFLYSVRLDFTDFFPSIKPEDLIQVLNDNNYKLSDTDERLITNICFYNLSRDTKSLAIGSPISPIISNVVCYKLDRDILNLALSVDNKSVVTRYADDVIFSTNVKRKCNDFVSRLTTLLKDTVFPNLSLNLDKTMYMSKKNRRKVTGLIITSEGLVSIGRKQKRYIKKLLNDLKYHSLNEDKLSYLQGYLAFILDAEPDFYNKLVLKYSSDLVNRALLFTQPRYTQENGNIKYPIYQEESN